MVELVTIVDQENNPIDVVPRPEMRSKKQPHRASFVVLENFNKRFYIERRTLTKDFCPGMLDACIGGVMTKGEDIILGAKRELKEELGVTTPLTWLNWLKIPLQGYGFIYGGLFYGKYDGPIVMQKEEVSNVLMLSEAEVLERSQECTPDSVIAFKEILKRLRSE